MKSENICYFIICCHGDNSTGTTSLEKKVGLWLWSRLISTPTQQHPSHGVEPGPQRLQCVLTVEGGPDVLHGQEAVHGDLIDDVHQQEGHAGEAQGLQQPPCVACGGRRGLKSIHHHHTLSLLRISTCYFSTQTHKEQLSFIRSATETFLSCATSRSVSCFWTLRVISGQDCIWTWTAASYSENSENNDSYSCDQLCCCMNWLGRWRWLGEHPRGISRWITTHISSQWKGNATIEQSLFGLKSQINIPVAQETSDSPRAPSWSAEE